MDNSTMPYRFYNPVAIELGPNALVPALTRIIGNTASRIGLFYGVNAMKQTGIIDEIKKTASTCRIVEWDKIDANPDITDIQDILRNLDGHLDWIIGIGGGSVLDVAKSVAFLLNQTTDIGSVLRGDYGHLKKNIPFIAVPTTSGTGSEVTQWATVWDNQSGKKYSLSHPYMYATQAIIDPVLTLSCPAHVTAHTGFDALCHAFEAYWSKYANPISDVLALESIASVFRHLPDLMKDLNNLRLRTQLCQASLNAGLAFSNTKTTAVHALSYPMTLEYGIPHGLACSLLLGEFLIFNKGHIDKHKAGRLLKALDCDTIEAVKHRIDSLKVKTGVPRTLYEVNIPRDGIEKILHNGFNPERVSNNPRHVSRQAARAILESLFDQHGKR